MSLLGLTSTVPVEVVLAAGLAPVDLNNRFVTHLAPWELVTRAEELGLPRTLCAWIKGIFAWLLEHPEVEQVVGITQGDCSNTHALLELLHLAGRRVLTFDYPPDRGLARMERELARFAEALGADLGRAEEIRRELLPLRHDLARLDEMTWQEGRITGWENHLWLVSSSDFDGDPGVFHARLREFLGQAAERAPREGRPRLGVLGVPTIITGLHEALEELGAAVVFNEVPRQFALLPAPEAAPDSLAGDYLRYTYPYDVFGRLADIRQQARLRRLDGLIHYTQTFCYRQVQDLALRQVLDLPILTLEGNQPGPVDGRTRLRLEAFLEMLAGGDNSGMVDE
ncbi:MAG: 2-hydroxyacyl-CoA dehydratase [Deltaproteobacteria bacterium]|nr:2-hydroxyacyl-CoA dehydratase [Deltaproteobacteria bacterium]